MAVVPNSPGLDRRTLLRGALAAGAGVFAGTALAGCDLFAKPSSETPEQTQQLDAFLAATVALGDRYDAAIAALPVLGPTLTPVRDAHRAHASALGSALGRKAPKATAEPPVLPLDRTAALGVLSGEEKTARDDAVSACLSASVRLTPLLASIAAARASHLEVLK
jgi:hypothetical protein